jgi:hypothetical protein
LERIKLEKLLGKQMLASKTSLSYGMNKEQTKAEIQNYTSTKGGSPSKSGGFNTQ